MKNQEWRDLLIIARRLLGPGEAVAWASDSWCAWTTFTSLEHHLTYWARGLPQEKDLLLDRTADGSLWMQSFLYSDIAHLIIPAQFYWERQDETNGFVIGYKTQDIKTLSALLSDTKIGHRITDKVLEVKLY